MPWYMNPVETRKVLNRIANRYQRTPLQDLKSVLDRATELIWSKQESYYQNRREPGQPCNSPDYRPRMII